MASRLRRLKKRDDAIRLFNSSIEPSTVRAMELQDEVNSKKPRINGVFFESDPCCSTENMVTEPITNITNAQPSTPVHVSVQTDLNMTPIKLPLQSPLVSALISPQKKPSDIRPNPLLSRAQSTVSISSVSNVSVCKKLTSFSSMCSIDLPSSSSSDSTKQPKLVEKKITRPRLRHTRTAALDGTDEPSEFGQNISEPKKRVVNFGGVDVYSFNFAQSFDTIPNETSIPLGMEYKHDNVKHYPSYRDFQREQFAENKDKYSLDSNMTGSKRRRIRRENSESANNSKAGRFAIPSFSAQNTRRISDSKWNTSDEECVEQYKKVSVPMGKRRKQEIIKSNSIQMDKETNDECLRIKLSRQFCGCSCQYGICKPGICECSVEGIGCQIDKPSFPCPCSKSSCENPNGRTEFDPDRVKEHYMKTLKRISFDKTDRKSPFKMNSLPADNLVPQPFAVPLTHYEFMRSPLSGSFEKLGLKTPPKSNTPIEKITPRYSKITTQFSSTGSISLPFKTPPNVTKRPQRRRYPVTPTYRQGNSNEQPSIIELDSTGQIMDFDDDSIQIIEPSDTLQATTIPNICEVLISSPNDKEFVLTQQVSISNGIHALSTSRSLSATTTDETSRTNSTEEVTMIRTD